MTVQLSWRKSVEWFVPGLASAWPWDPSVPDDVGDAYRFLGVEDAESRLASGDALGALLTLVVGSLLLIARPSLAPLSVVCGVVPPLAVRRGPVVIAAIARTRALGMVPSLYARLTLRLRLEPSLERAVRFAAATGDDRLTGALAAHANRAAASPESGLRSFAASWGEWDPTIERASALVAAAAGAPPADRERGCERALETVLEGTQQRVASFANDVRGPVTGLYAFGVLLPLALVGVLPAARVAGLSVPTLLIVVVYDVVLPAVLLVTGIWLLTERPVAFPAPRVGRHHPAVPDRRTRAIILGVGAGLCAVIVARYILPWAAPLVGIGVGAGVVLVDWFGPARAVREEVVAIETGLPDALTLVGRRVAEGSAVERALEVTADELPGRTGDLLSAAAARGRNCRVDVERSFFGSLGVLDTVPSSRTRDAARLMTLATAEGQPAGDVLVAAGDHLRELQRVERAATRELAAVTGTLANTAVLFGPLVGGVTVAMVGRLSSTPSVSQSSGAAPVSSAGGTGGIAAAGAAGGSALDPLTLGLAVGLYALLLAAELTALATILEEGLDPTLVAYRVGVALPVASVAYLTAVVVAGQFL